MGISNFVPQALKDMRRRRIINKQFGEGNRIVTLMVHPSVKLGRNIYLAKNVDARQNVEIDDNSYCSPGTVLFNGTKVGKFCSIGYNVQIGCPEHPTRFLSTSPTIYRDGYIKRYCDWPEDDIKDPVIIGNDVWIGSNAMTPGSNHWRWRYNRCRSRCTA